MGNAEMVSGDDVAAWLKANPDFFMDHADVFSAMRVPHPQWARHLDGGRQLISLRDRNSHEAIAGLIGYGQPMMD